MNRKHLKRTLSALLITSFLVGAPLSISHAGTTSTTTTKTATTTGKSTTTPPANAPKDKAMVQVDLKAILDKLVTAKTITAAQEKKILAAEEAKKAAKTTPPTVKTAEKTAAKPAGRFDDLVKAKVITQKQADAITKAVDTAIAAAQKKASTTTTTTTKTTK